MHEERLDLSGFAEREFGKSSACKFIGAFLVLAFLGGVQIWAQQNSSLQNSAQQGQDGIVIQPTPHPQTRSPFGDFGPMDPILIKRQVVLLNAQRQKNMISDADKLLKLATELKAEIDAGNPASLSSEQLHKIAEIEKLAHSIKQKMSLSIGGGPTVSDAFP